jgi:hypothetical protein
MLVFISCNKDPYSDTDNLVLPPITMEGKNTFGCEINGKVWVPFVQNPGLFHQKLSDIVEPPSIGIHAILHKDDDKIYENIYIDCVATGIGKYHIPPPTF